MEKTERQKAWMKASKEEFQKGNEFTGFLFALLSQPNEQEKKVQK